ncbi:ThiF family adenylyltransferase [Oleiharenicola lentus]|uniref:ThiF family adenylyltransferase n=1 Tax=Oleiharenicola lentus TaxID=2508720 RepID=UPI003F66A8F8
MKANALSRYFDHPRTAVRARMISGSRKGADEIFVIEVDVDLPQRPLYKINKTERVEIRMPDDDSIPRVYALRKTLPALPHTMAGESPYPRQLCLYERPWSEERTNWSPRSFVERVRRWFSGTADGTLHPDDQPLEPVLQHSPLNIVLPAIPFAPGVRCRLERLFILARRREFLVARRERPEGLAADVKPFPVVIVQAPTVHHGLMHRLPLTLGDLESLLAGMGGSLVQAIATQLEKIRDEVKALPEQPLLLVLELPKTRQPGGPVETVEHRAFFVGKTLAEVFATETVQVKEGALYVPKTKELFMDPSRLKTVQILPLSVRWHLNPESAAAMNGHRSSSLKIVSIGAGALGSQVSNNLWRGGFGEWTIVDDDHYEAHNPARHLFSSEAVGLPKAAVLAKTMAAVFPDRPEPGHLVCNYLSAGTEAGKLSMALKSAELILDFSASVTVERRLAVDEQTNARRASVFLNQRGDESVLLIEDTERHQNLFWLEALYYRAVAYDPHLRGHFDDAGAVAHRYGNGCREISTVVPQDGVALHAAQLSHAIRKASAARQAAVVVYRWSRDTGATTVVSVPMASPYAVTSAGWQILLHPEVVIRLAALRGENLPNETGGVLMGLVDRTHRSIAVVGLMPAPSDSMVWPTSFSRGSNGLSAEVARLGKRTLGNLTYLGEWHSHPEGCDSSPSAQDVIAVAMCAPNTRADALPTLMMIVAADDVSFVLQPTDEDKLYLTKIHLPLPSL